MEKLLQMKGITKRFGDITANDRIDFELNKGEIHGLLGENGAGKTTLMNILYGLYTPDEGEIYINGAKVEIKSPHDAIKLGISMVHQNFKLIQSHTVIENVALGLKDTNFFYPNRQIEKEIRTFSEKYNFKIDPNVPVWQLSAGEKQRVEIIKAFCRKARIFILDEPTTMLTPNETRDLFRLLKFLREEGISVILITHKLDEVMNICDRVTVLRGGKKVGTIDIDRVDKDDLARMMFGQDIILKEREEYSISFDEDIVLEVRDLTVFSDKGLPAVKDISFDIHRGEILGIAGVSGNGQRELIEAITGLRKVARGSIKILGEDVTNVGTKEILNKGVAHIPEERMRVGVIPSMSLEENIILRSYDKSPFSNGILLDYSVISEYAKELISRYKISALDEKIPAGTLSGGNIQKLILARELSISPVLIIASHPTQGLDIRSTQQIHELLLRKKEEGCAILLVSEDLQELMDLSDRIAVMFNGTIRGIIDIDRASIEEIGSLMVGV
ncbi:MAG: ABC transporter ATP-binding protein [bacterium]|nr:ABC transporter ATP-binding protein [bacterium]